MKGKLLWIVWAVAASPGGHAAEAPAEVPEAGPEEAPTEMPAAGELRLGLREQGVALGELVGIVEALEVVARQREAVDHLLGDSAEAERLRDAIGAVSSGPPARRLNAAPPLARPLWVPAARDLLYVQGQPERVVLQHRSGGRLDLAKGEEAAVAGDRVALVSVLSAASGRPTGVELEVNGVTRRVPVE